MMYLSSKTYFRFLCSKFSFVFVVFILVSSCNQEIDPEAVQAQLESQQTPTGYIPTSGNATDSDASSEPDEIEQTIKAAANEVEVVEEEKKEKVARMISEYLTLQEVVLNPNDVNIENLKKGKSYTFSALGKYIFADEDAEITPELVEDSVINEINLTSQIQYSVDTDNIECVTNPSTIQCITKDFGVYRIRFKFASGKVYKVKGEIEDPGMTSIGLSPALNEMYLDEQSSVQILAFYADGRQIDITEDSNIWLENEDSEVLKLKKNNDGEWFLAAIGNGRETIKYSYKDFTQSWKVNVVGPTLIGLEIKDPLTPLVSEEDFNIYAVGYYSDNTTRDISDRVKWVLDSKFIKPSDTAENNNDFFGIKDGDTQVTIKFGGYENTKTLTIEPGLLLETFYVSPEYLEFGMGMDYQIYGLGKTPEGEIGDVTSRVTWTSSDESIFKINDEGLLTPVKIGIATLTAQYKDFPQVVKTVTILPPQVVELKIVPKVLVGDQTIEDDWDSHQVLCGYGLDGGETKNWHAYRLIATFSDGSEEDNYATNAKVSWVTSDIARMVQIVGDDLVVTDQTYHEDPFAFFETLKISDDPEDTVVLRAEYLLNATLGTKVIDEIAIETVEAPPTSLELNYAEILDPDIEIKENSDGVIGRPIGTRMDFAVKTIHPCGLNYDMEVTEVLQENWSIVEENIPIVEDFSFTGPGELKTAVLKDGSDDEFVDMVNGDGDLYAQKFTVKAVFQNELERMIEGELEVEVRPAELNDIKIYLKDRSIEDESNKYLLREFEKVELVVEGTYTNNNILGYEDMRQRMEDQDTLHSLAPADRFTWTIEDTSILDRTEEGDPMLVYLKAKDGVFGETDIKLQYAKADFEENESSISFEANFLTGSLCPDDLTYGDDQDPGFKFIGNGNSADASTIMSEVSEDLPLLNRGLRSQNFQGCYYLGTAGQNCNDVCAAQTLGDFSHITGTPSIVLDETYTRNLGSASTFTGNAYTNSECYYAMDNYIFNSVKQNPPFNTGAMDPGYDLGCGYFPSTGYIFRVLGGGTDTSFTDAQPSIARMCSCKVNITP